MEENKDTAKAGAGAAPEEHHGGKFMAGRRAFLGAFAGCIGALGAGLVGVPLLASFTPVQRGKPEPAILNLDDIPKGGSARGVYAGYSFMVFNRKSGIEAISLKCTHLGCTVKWEPAKQIFRCPCHDGWYNKHGVNKGGPPPAPLEHLAYKIVGSKLIVGGA